MYSLINIIVLVLAVSINRLPLDRRKTEKIFLLGSGAILIFISGFRGDFTPDYRNYNNFFNTIKTMSFKDLLLGNINIEPGYAMFNKLVSIFTSNYNVFLLIISFIIIYLYFDKIYRYSPYAWLSVLLLLNFGSYYTSFNTLRQFLVGALLLLSMEYVYKKQFFKYCISIMLIFLIHKSVIIMIPLYFILRIKWNKLSHLLMSVSIAFFYVIVLFFQETFVDIATSTLYSQYALDTVYIDVGVPILALLRPISILLIIIMLAKYINLEDTKELVWLNSTIILLLVSILSVNVVMFQRFTYYFLPYMIFLIPTLISRITNKKIKVAFISMTVMLILFYGFITNVNSEYFFVWQK